MTRQVSLHPAKAGSSAFQGFDDDDDLAVLIERRELCWVGEGAPAPFVFRHLRSGPVPWRGRRQGTFEGSTVSRVLVRFTRDVILTAWDVAGVFALRGLSGLRFTLCLLARHA